MKLLLNNLLYIGLGYKMHLHNFIDDEVPLNYLIIHFDDRLEFMLQWNACYFNGYLQYDTFLT